VVGQRTLARIHQVENHFVLRPVRRRTFPIGGPLEPSLYL